MSLAENVSIRPSNADERWLSVVGIGDDGWDELGSEARRLVENTKLIVGGSRHIEMLPDVHAETQI